MSQARSAEALRPRVDTKELIFDTAERLFAEEGLAAVSVRSITGAAGVNLAAITYHFGSKDNLLLEIYTRRGRELNEERIAALNVAETANGAGPPSVREILRALLGPPLLWSEPGRGREVASRFLVRARTEGTPEIRRETAHAVRHLKRFAAALQKALPELPRKEIYRRLVFSIGVYQSMVTDAGRLASLSDGTAGASNIPDLIERVLDFAEAGMRAPARPEARGKAK